MGNELVLLGQFLARRAKSPDTSEDPYSENGRPKPGKSFLDVDTDLPPDNGPVTVAAFEPPPALGRPPGIVRPEHPGPDPLRASPSQPSQAPGSPPGPWDVRAIPDTPPTHPAGLRSVPGPTPPPALPQRPQALQGALTKAFPAEPPQDPGPGSGASPLQDPGLDPNMFRPLAPGGQIDPARDALFQMQTTDQRVLSFLARVDAVDPLDSDPTKGRYYPNASSGGPGSFYSDPRLTGAHLHRLSEHLGAAGILRHSLTQLSLFALNKQGKVWNPANLAPTGGGMDSQGPNLAGALAGQMPGLHEKGEVATDTHRALAEGRHSDAMALSYPPFVSIAVQMGMVGPHNILNVLPPRLIGAQSQDRGMLDDIFFDPVNQGRPIVDAALSTRNLHSPDSPSSEGRPFEIRDLFRGATDGKGSDVDLLRTDPESGMKRPDLSKVFDPLPRVLAGPPMEYRPKPDVAALRSQNRDADPLERSFFRRGVVPAGFDLDNDSSFVQHGTGESPTDSVGDDDAYVPLSFTDLRPYGRGKLRTVFFRPFIVNVSEEFSPSWDSQEAFGRVDSVQTYKSTGRVLTLSFEVQAFAPEDLPVIYRKKTWLESMVYPEYGRHLTYKSGPVVRLRVGDLFNTSLGGLPGKIDSLGFEYSSRTWELERGSKVPMGFTVTMGFTVLHDTPIGRGNDGKFGGLGSIGPDGIYAPPKTSIGSGDEGGPEVTDSRLFRNYADVDGYDASTKTGDREKPQPSGEAPRTRIA